MEHNALIHDSVDDVAVVIVDISAGDTVSTVDLDGNSHEDEAAEMARNINGRLTAAEALRHNEFVITKRYRSA